MKDFREQFIGFVRCLIHRPPAYLNERANGERYPRVGGRRERCFAGTSLQPRKLPENAATPTRRVHAVLASMS